MSEPRIELAPFQAEGVRHLLRQPHGGILSDPGTRKTATVLSAFHLLRKKRLVERMLVVGTLNAVYDVWPAEVDKWGFPFSVAVLHGDKKDRALHDAAFNDVDVWCVNFDGLEWLFSNTSQALWRANDWWLVVDESTKLKHTNTRRFKTIKPYLPLFSRRTILTGTPSPNGMEDLFGQVYVCDLGSRLGRFVTQYRREFFYPTGYGGYSWSLQPDAEERIWEKLDGMFYRVSDDVLRLKPLERVQIQVRLPEAARKIYEELEREFVVQLGRRSVKAVNAGVLTHKLRQCANGFLYDDKGRATRVHAAKLDALGDLAEELCGKPLLVGYEFEEDGRSIAEKFDCPAVGGKISKRESSELFKKFNAGKMPVLAAQMAKNAHALNLQEACHHVCEYGQLWDLEVREQFYRRVRRSGQKHTVFLHEIVARSTVDVDIRNQVVSGRGSKKTRQDRLLTAIVERYEQ